MNPADIPEYKDREDYIPDSWTEYETWELGMWVHLLLKRAEHRQDNEKALKDVEDARNYHRMMAVRIERKKMWYDGTTHGV